MVVVPLVAIDTLHASTFIVTLLTAMTWLPWVLIGVPAGAWVDRLPPRAVMLAGDAVAVAAYASVPVAAWCGVLTVAQLIAVALVAGAAAVFFHSAYQLLLPGVVDEPDLAEGNAKLLGSREVAQIGGPGLGGLLAQAGGLCLALLLPLADDGPRLAFAGAALLGTGGVVVIANVIVDSFMQAYVPPGIFGRVISATTAVGFAMMPAGALLAGGLATALGVRVALWILTAVIAASGLIFLLTPLRRLRDLPRRPGQVSDGTGPAHVGPHVPPPHDGGRE